ncbi:MAG: outer membrane protein W [Salibacteraceae bacterium]|jgi:outer membrane protein W
MKKLILICFGAIALSTSNVSAQALEQGNVSIDVYYGFPNIYASVFTALYSNGTETNLSSGGVGPLGIRGEYMVADKFGVGVDVAFSNAKVAFDYNSSVFNPVTNDFDPVTYTDEFKTSKISAIVTFNYHFLDNDNVDFYGMVGAGYKNRNFTFTSTDPDFDAATANVSVTLIPVAIRLGVGVRYFFTDNLGINMQLGFGHSAIVNGGLALKF